MTDFILELHGDGNHEVVGAAFGELIKVALANGDVRKAVFNYGNSANRQRAEYHAGAPLPAELGGAGPETAEASEDTETFFALAPKRRRRAAIAAAIATPETETETAPEPAAE